MRQLLILSYLALWLAVAFYVAAWLGGLHRLARAAQLATVASWGLLTTALLTRGLSAGHWPLTNRYEFALCFTWATLGCYLLLISKQHLNVSAEGTFVTAVALLIATYALLRPADEKAIRPLLPALRSVWLQVHVVTAAMGYGTYGVAAGLAAMMLLHSRLPSQERLSPTQTIERDIERVVGWGFPWLTLGILAGAVWAQEVWGRYWGWDPKETWSLITWLWYLLILHIRGLRKWGGRRLAWLTLAGFGIVLFTFAGLPWLVRVVRLESLHAF